MGSDVVTVNSQVFRRVTLGHGFILDRARDYAQRFREQLSIDAVDCGRIWDVRAALIYPKIKQRPSRVGRQDSGYLQFSSIVRAEELDEELHNSIGCLATDTPSTRSIVAVQEDVQYYT